MKWKVTSHCSFPCGNYENKNNIPGQVGERKGKYMNIEYECSHLVLVQEKDSSTCN